jgi:HlyD family secretion protein
VDAFFHPAPGTDASALPPLGRVVDLRIELPAEPDVVALPIGSLYDNDRIYAVEDNRLRAIHVERVGELQLPDGDYRVLVRSPELAGRAAGDHHPAATRGVSGLLVEAS